MTAAADIQIAERDLQQAVIDTARTFAWTVAHFRAAQTSKGWRTPVAADGKGFPDLVLAHPDGRLIFAELKRLGGRITPEQARWLELLRQVADANELVEAHVWTPLEWPAPIVQILSGRQVIAVA